MSKKLLTYIIFFSLLLAAFYYFLFKGTDNWKVQLPILSYVQPFHFTNQDGQAFSDKELLNKITVVEYFFTTCKGICPKLNTNMKEIYSIYKKEKSAVLPTLSFYANYATFASSCFYKVTQVNVPAVCLHPLNSPVSVVVLKY